MALDKNLSELPAGLPIPVDDGAANHLPGMQMPDIALPATMGGAVELSKREGRTVVFIYPRTGVPGAPSLADDWEMIPGARGCTPQSCSFRDQYAELKDAGAEVFGLSTQDTAFQREAVARLHLPFSLLSDAELRFTRALNLPTLIVSGITLLKRMGLVLRDGKIEHVFYPVFPPNEHADKTLRWLLVNPA